MSNVTHNPRLAGANFCVSPNKAEARGWGDGQWMRDWVERTDNANANIYTGEGLMAHETPDETMLEQCRDFGRGFAAY